MQVGCMNKSYVPKEIVEKAFQSTGWRCAYCGIALTPENNTVDHFIPRSKNGASSADNIKASCMSCNTIKGNRVFPTVDAVRRFIRERVGIPPETTPAPFEVKSRNLGGKLSREGERRKKAKWRSKNKGRYRAYMREYMRARRAAEANLLA